MNRNRKTELADLPREAALAGARAVRAFVRNRRGSAAAEFAMVLPVLSLLLLSIIKMGIMMNNYIELTDGVRAASRQFAVSRTDATPYTDGVSIFYASAANLAKANVNLSVLVAGSACTADAGCQTALTNGQGLAVKVSATYPCDLVIMGMDLAPSCMLSSSTSERVE